MKEQMNASKTLCKTRVNYCYQSVNVINLSLSQSNHITRNQLLLYNVIRRFNFVDVNCCYIMISDFSTMLTLMLWKQEEPWSKP